MLTTQMKATDHTAPKPHVRRAKQHSIAGSSSSAAWAFSTYPRAPLSRAALLMQASLFRVTKTNFAIRRVLADALRNGDSV